MSTHFSYFSEKINNITPLESNFLQGLRSIALKPKMLYYYGKLPCNQSRAVAIVGSRHNTPYGEEVAYRAAYELAKKGIIIISGLAYGIDSIAHRATLDAGGCTIAILGTPIDKIYPRRHIGLAHQIIESGGAIISEYAPRRQEYFDAPLAADEVIKENRRLLNPKTTFLQRNRLIAGLSDAVLIVEAAERSGTLNTAAHALNQGKDVFAVPGNITNINSKGCNRLISQGAIPYTEPEDIIKVLYPELIQEKRRSSTKIMGDNEAETMILRAIAAGINDGEEIVKKLNISAESFSRTITFLEIKLKVRALGANRWGLI